MMGETQDPKQTPLVEPGAQELRFKWTYQISYKQDLSNKIFDLQSHYKTTAAIVGNKFLFIIWFKYAQNKFILS